jgi:hypothetical protein
MFVCQFSRKTVRRRTHELCNVSVNDGQQVFCMTVPEPVATVGTNINTSVAYKEIMLLENNMIQTRMNIPPPGKGQNTAYIRGL